MKLPILLTVLLTASFLYGCANSLESALDAQATATRTMLETQQISEADESVNHGADEGLLDSKNSLSDLEESDPDIVFSDGEVNPKLAFPVGYPDILRGKELRRYLPDAKWILQSESPLNLSLVYDLFIRNKNELWMAVNTRNIMKYMIDSGEWVAYNTVDDVEMVPHRLLFTSRGEIWGYNNFGFDIPYYESPILSRYNPVTDKFESVMDNEGLLVRSRLDPKGNLIEDDKTGIFWMVLEDRRRKQLVLFSFDPKNNIAHKHIDLGETPIMPSFLVAAPDGNIWMVDYEELVLKYYDPVAQELRTFQETLKSTYIEMPKSTMGISPERGSRLYVDRCNRLWVGDIGWLDFSDPNNLLWYKVIRSPVFLAEWHLPTSYYTWVRPDFIYHATNGIYWFSSIAGIVRLDPETADWSLITTYNSAIAEDDDQNIWIVMDDEVYKHESSQKTMEGYWSVCD